VLYFASIDDLTLNLKQQNRHKVKQNKKIS